MTADSVVKPESTDPSAPRETNAKRPAPWRGRQRAEAGEAKDKWIGLRVTAADLDRIEEKAQEAGFKIGGYLRVLALGSAGPRAARRPVVERERLAQLLGKIGRLNSSINQIVKHTNATLDPPGAPVLDEMRSDIAAMRAAVMQALGHGD